ncbi:MAG: DUF134 domain-containing protein [Desulfovibrio sp.]|nr:DUF134 domain-containing protein [Desulfovibrio sp.]
MARPRHCRYVEKTPGATYFKPCGVPLSTLDEVTLSVEGLEALRLADLNGLSATEASARCRVSRHAFGRTLAQARRAVAEALVAGKALRIEGGSFALIAPAAGAARRRRKTMSLIVAISSEGPDLGDAVDPRYGRAGGFVLAEFADGDLAKEPTISYLDNGDAQIMATGAGIATTEHLANAGVATVLSGFVGPKAFEALEAAGIAVVQNMDNQTVGEALKLFREGKCSLADAPNREAGNPAEQM